jgi:hypothetical protein
MCHLSTHLCALNQKDNVWKSMKWIAYLKLNASPKQICLSINEENCVKMMRNINASYLKKVLMTLDFGSRLLFTSI